MNLPLSFFYFDYFEHMAITKQIHFWVGVWQNQQIDFCNQQWLGSAWPQDYKTLFMLNSTEISTAQNNCYA